MKRLVVFAGLLACVLGAAQGCDSVGAAPIDRDDASTTTPIDCSRVGCAPPPPCGQKCTEPCGCCVNQACAVPSGDASADAVNDGDAAADASADAPTEAGDASSDASGD